MRNIAESTAKSACKISTIPSIPSLTRGPRGTKCKLARRELFKPNGVEGGERQSKLLSV
jgi:hypothetical protein